MKKVLIPIDGTERSKKSINLAKDLYRSDEVDITILAVREDVEWMRSEQDFTQARDVVQPMLDETAAQLDGYQVKTMVSFGRAGEEILYVAEEEDIDIIIMTKSTRGGWYRMIGSVTSHVVKYAQCIVVIVPEIGAE